MDSTNIFHPCCYRIKTAKWLIWGITTVWFATRNWYLRSMYKQRNCNLPNNIISWWIWIRGQQRWTHVSRIRLFVPRDPRDRRANQNSYLSSPRWRLSFREKITRMLLYTWNACIVLCAFLYLKFESLVKARVGGFLVHRRLQLMSVIRKQLNDDVRVTRLAPFLFKWWQIQRLDELYSENGAVLIKLNNKMSLAKIVRRRGTIRTTRSESIFILLCKGDSRITSQLEVILEKLSFTLTANGKRQR